VTPAATLLDQIGRTPMLRLRSVVPADCGEVWLKWEGTNPTGSYKDRMALAVITGLLERGEVAPGDRVVEYTGGSTGAAAAFVCALSGLRFTAVTSDAFAPSKLQAISAFGGELVVEHSPDGTLNPELFGRMRQTVRRLADEPGTVYFDQFGSPDVRPGYAPLGVEIAEALDGRVDVMCAAVGTAGSLMGAVDGLRVAGIAPDVYAVEPSQSPFLSTGTGGSHRVEGIALGFAPPFLDLAAIAGVRVVDQEEGFAMCRRLAREEGLLAGGSTGLNVVAAIGLARELGPGSRVVTIGCDTGIKYLGGHIYA